MSELSLINFAPLIVQKRNPTQFKIPNTEEYAFSLINNINDLVHHFYIIMYLIYYDIVNTKILGFYDYKFLLEKNYFSNFIKSIKSTHLEKIYNDIKDKDTIKIYQSIMDIVNKHEELKQYNIFNFKRSGIYLSISESLQVSAEYLQQYKYIINNLIRLKALHSKNLDYLLKYILLIMDNKYIQNMNNTIIDLNYFSYLFKPKENRSYIQISEVNLNTYLSNLDKFKSEILYCNKIINKVRILNSMDDEFKKKCTELIEIFSKKPIDMKNDLLYNYTEKLYNLSIECINSYYSIPQVFNVIEKFLTHLISACSSYNKVINVLKTEQQKINDYLNNLQSIQHNFKSISDLKTLLLTDEQYTLDNLHEFGKTPYKVHFNEKDEVKEFNKDDPIEEEFIEPSNEDESISGGIFNSLYNLLFYKNPN